MKKEEIKEINVALYSWLLCIVALGAAIALAW